jgi:AraC-like DNA-binding protein
MNKKLIITALFLHKKRLLFIIPILVFLLALLLTQFNKMITIFPNKEDLYDIHTYCDGSENGATEITEAEISNNQISFEYTLKKKYSYPYAGLFIMLMVDSVFLDISKYNYLSLELESENTESFTVYLKAFMDEFTKINQASTHEHLMKEVTVDSLSSVYRINFHDFIHPPWWLEQSKIGEEDIGKPRFSKIISMQIQHGLFTPFDTPIKINIKKIAFVRDNTSRYALTTLCIVFYFIIYLVIFLIIQRKNKVISYKELAVKNDADEDIKRIMNTVAKNYADPAFTVEKLAREAGVSASKIPGMLKERFDLNFKQYLNTIRIAEAKRLLRETDNQIVTIAYTVGYNNIPHFNRTFKQFEGISPKEYRKGQREEKES